MSYNVIHKLFGPEVTRDQACIFVVRQNERDKSTWSSLMPAFIWKNNVTGSCNMARVEKLHVVPDLLRIQLQDQF